MSQQAVHAHDDFDFQPDVAGDDFMVSLD